jgi:hypothetical protein
MTQEQEVTNDLDVYKTKDLYEASLLYCKKLEFKGMKRDAQVCWFKFGNKIECKRLSEDFWAKKARVDAKSYSEAVRSLKDMIFS